MLYVIKLSVSLAVLWIFYQLLLRRLTFYNLNRWYLLGYSVLCFFIPLVDVGPALGPPDQGGVVGLIPVVVIAAPVSRPEWGIWDVLAAVFLVGAAVLLTVVGWYNPFVWLIRYSIRQNLEFIADRQVVGSGVDRKAYQYHLLNVVGRPAYRLANSFNFSSLKKRIVMMNKVRSARVHLVKFLFVLPLLAVLLLAFRSTYKRVSRAQRSAAVTDMTMQAGVPKVKAEAAVTADRTVRSRHRVTADTVKGNQALTLFGERGKDGVVAATTKEFHSKHREMNDTIVTRVRPLFNVVAPKGGAQPLYVVDGKEMTEMPADLDPNTIESVSVLKDEHARAIYGDKGKNGVIIIVLKKKSSYVPKMTINGKDGPMSIMADTIRTDQGGEQVVITAEKVAGR